MEVLGAIERCMHSIPQDLYSDKILYVELSKHDFDEVEKSIEYYTTHKAEFSIEHQKKVKDFGVCSILTYMGYKVVISVNKNKTTDGDFFIAFKSKVV